jgi:hypothetical protein
MLNLWERMEGSFVRVRSDGMRSGDVEREEVELKRGVVDLVLIGAGDEKSHFKRSCRGGWE